MTTKNLSTRRATIEDLHYVIDMIQELADFEEMPHGPKLTVADLIRDGGYDLDHSSRNPPLFYCFVVEEQERTSDEQPLNRSAIIGYAICFHIYSTWEGKGVFLEDIYIKRSHQGKGAGKLLFKEIVKFAIESKCSRFDFHVLDWNPARGFYELLGAKNLTEKEGWQYYRLNKDEMNKLN